ncbi:MAG TPA: hypothetical protein ENO22_08180 [candidate division Zixibacteria bacterium]|nr:hypothetical protein [candidate division Zixibacteria bacterium]
MPDRIYFILSAVLITLISLMVADLHADHICGDTNSDSALNISDAVWVMNYVFTSGAPPDPTGVGDCNCDAACNISDAIVIINYVFTDGYLPCDPDEDGSPDCDPDCPLIMDVDGNLYQTILIGEQCWMAENLKVTHYRNGDPLPNVTDAGAWNGLTSGAYCDYNNDDGQVEVYGRLYNWYALIDSRNIAPEGWHLPTDAEWKQLEMFLGMSQADADATGWRGTDEGGKLKEAGMVHWNSPNTGATNESGFTALPGGYRVNTGAFLNMGTYAYLWSSTESGAYTVWGRLLSSGVATIYRYADSKAAGFSVRCIRD